MTRNCLSLKSWRQCCAIATQAYFYVPEQPSRSGQNQLQNSLLASKAGIGSRLRNREHARSRSHFPPCPTRTYLTTGNSVLKPLHTADLQLPDPRFIPHVPRSLRNSVQEMLDAVRIWNRVSVSLVAPSRLPPVVHRHGMSDVYSRWCESPTICPACSSTLVSHRTSLLSPSGHLRTLKE